MDSNYSNQESAESSNLIDPLPVNGIPNDAEYWLNCFFFLCYKLLVVTSDVINLGIQYASSMPFQSASKRQITWSGLTLNPNIMLCNKDSQRLRLGPGSLACKLSHVDGVQPSSANGESLPLRIRGRGVEGEECRGGWGEVRVRDVGAGDLVELLPPADKLQELQDLVIVCQVCRKVVIEEDRKCMLCGVFLVCVSVRTNGKFQVVAEDFGACFPLQQEFHYFDLQWEEERS